MMRLMVSFMLMGSLMLPVLARAAIVSGSGGASSIAGAGCLANASAPSNSEGAVAACSQDLAGNTRITPGTLNAGEDLTATGANSSGVTVVENRYLTAGVKTSDFQVKGAAGFVHCVHVAQADAAPTAGTIAILDNLAAGGGTTLWSWTLTTAVFNPFTVCLDTSAATGIFIDFTTTADVNVTVTYR